MTNLRPRSRLPGGRSLFAPAWLLAGAALALLAPALRAQVVDIGVRSTVVDKSLQWSHQTASPDEGGHGKSFAILKIDLIKSDQKLVKPVDEQAILRQLFHQLEVNGFHPYAKGTTPDILLTVSYGRGDMHNPYIRDQGETPTMDGTPTVSITGAFAQQIMDEKTPGYEANLQKASFEKLFIRVTAWETPATKTSKPKMLWKTIIVADDPDHRDLNAIAAQMIEAGAPYFDKALKKPEIDFYQPMREGRVNVGTPEVVDAPPKTTK